MKKTKDEEINKILARAEEYREKYNKKLEMENNVKFDIDANIGDIFREFFGNFKELDYDDENNVFVNYKLTKDELVNGCEKTIKFKVKEKDNKNIVKKMKIKIPQNVSDGQKIIVRGCGNFINEKKQYSDLVINIFKKGRRWI